MARKALNIGFFLIIFLLFFEAVRIVANGWIPFWYDPGRDLLLARDNLQKISLIGPPSGIPGVFYLPYWTWLDSFGLAVSSDPKVITFITIVIPYFLVLTFIFKKFTKVYGSVLSFSLLILFLLTFQNLTTQFWSPNPAPLLFAGLVLAVLGRKYFVAGILVGLGVGFNMGFGIGIMIITTLYVVYDSRRNLKNLVSFFVGLGLIFIPFFVFEMRHGFNQIQSLFGSLAASPVGLAGLSKQEMLGEFFETAGKIIPLPVVILLAVLLILFRRNLTISNLEKRLFFYLVFCLAGLLTIYFLSKNPKWDYHFVGVEMLLLLLVGLVIKWTRLLPLLVVWIGVLFVFYFLGGGRPVVDDFKQNLYLLQKEKVVKTIINDSKGNSFAVRAYNPAIYSFDYDYIFWWLGKTPSEKSEQVYLIIPPTEKSIHDGFIESQTPDQKYHTVFNWSFSDGTRIYRRQL